MQKILLLLFILPYSVFSQNTEDQPEESRYSFGIVPQYAIINGLRTDFEFKLNNRNNWLVLAPQLYISNNGNLNWDYNKMLGAGIEIQHKIFVNKTPNKKGVYFAYGPTFNYFSVKDNGLTAQAFEEDGANYFGLEEGEITTNIYKIGGNFIVGVQIVIAKVMYIDPYVGMGIRFSFDDQTTGLHDYYNEWWADMGYSGTLMVSGVRIGVNF
jgi:hypothetical protein